MPDPPEVDVALVRPDGHGPRGHEVVSDRGQPVGVTYELTAKEDRRGLQVERRVGETNLILPTRRVGGGLLRRRVQASKPIVGPRARAGVVKAEIVIGYAD